MAPKTMQDPGSLQPDSQAQDLPPNKTPIPPLAKVVLGKPEQAANSNIRRIFTRQEFTRQVFTRQVFTRQLFTRQVFTRQEFTRQVFTRQVFTRQVFTRQCLPPVFLNKYFS